MREVVVGMRSVDSLIPYARNARTHSDAQVAQIAASIREFGWTNPILVDGESGIIAGHGRLLAARKLNMPEVPCIELSSLSEIQKRAYILADNKLALNAGWDDEMLRLELGELAAMDFDTLLTGFSDEELLGLNDGATAVGERSGNGNLSDRFMLPPFSVLNAREGWWQERKKAWIAVGIKSEIGRTATVSGSKMVAKYSADGNRHTGMVNKSDTSVFDPVVCELACRWFSPAGGIILDPFAGGSVRGIVASKLGRQYVGVDLRPEQIEANKAQGDDICADSEFPPVWYCGDSRNIAKTCSGVQADFIFSCPPYADLEVYSDDPADLSTLSYGEFRQSYFEIVEKSCSLLKQDRFAAFVVGEVRDKRGNYYDFVGDTVQAFRSAGLDYCNEAILITMVGSLPIRAAKQFSSSRKLGKTHQNILVFCKGDQKKAAAACGEVVVCEDLFPEHDEPGESCQ